MADEEDKDRKFEFDDERAFADGNDSLGEELMLKELDEQIERMERTDREFYEALENFLKGNVPAEIHDDAPLSIEDVLNLPEMGGSFTVNPEFRRKGEHVNDNMIHSAIKDGRLTPLPLPAKKLLLTRRKIKKMLECPTTRPSSSARTLSPPRQGRAGRRRTPDRRRSKRH